MSGRVQGVGYRYFAVRLARSMNLTGWVRNNPEGSVDMEVQGDSEKLGVFVQNLRSGPSLAAVINLVQSDIPLYTHEVGFEVKY